MARKSRKNRYQSMQLEELEPRVMFSADWQGVFSQETGESDRWWDAQQDPELDAVVPVDAAPGREELVFIDSRTPNHQQILEDIQARQGSTSLDVIFLDAQRDGVAQIAQVLAQRDALDAVHIISHGEDGSVQLGNKHLDAAGLSSQELLLGSWAHGLSADADLLFYGCDLASGESGREFLTALAGLTGADVAASDDLTGSAALGGDWNLEYKVGDIETTVAVSTDLQTRYQSVLAVNAAPEINNLDDTPTFVEDGPGVIMDGDVTLLDDELDSFDDWAGASITLVRTGGANADDLFGFADGGDYFIVGNNLEYKGDVLASVDDSTSGQIVLTFTSSGGHDAHAYHIEDIAQRLTYSNTNDLPPANVSIDWIVNDGNNGGLQGTGGPGITTQSTTVSVTATNDAPAFTGFVINPQYDETGAPTLLDTSVSISDPELDSLNSGQGNYGGTTFTLVRDGGASIDDVFTFIEGNGYTLVGGNLMKGGLTIATVDTLTAGQMVFSFTSANGQIPTSTDVNAIAHQITYANAAAVLPNSVPISWSLNDGNTGTQGLGGAKIGASTVVMTLSAPPVADAGGPVNIFEGDTLSLDASGSTDPNLDPLIYRWDIDNDGVFDVSSIGETVSLTWAQLSALGLDDDGTYTIGLEVDDGKFTDTDSVAVQIANTAPIVDVGGAATVEDHVGVFTLNLAVVDPGNETIETWYIDWGDGNWEEVDGSETSWDHVYTTPGLTANISVAVKDGDGTFFQNNLLVASTGSDDLLVYDGITGDLVRAFDDPPAGVTLEQTSSVVIGPDGLAYVLGANSENVLRYNASTGTYVDEFITGLKDPWGFAFGPNGNLFVSSSSDNDVHEYSIVDGSDLGQFAAPNGLSSAQYIAFGPDGNLYVGGWNSQQINRYDGFTGEFIDVFVSSGDGGLAGPEQFTFGPDGHFYVASYYTDSIMRFDGVTGVFKDTFADINAEGFGGPAGIKFGADKNLYVSSWSDNNVLKFDGSDGSFLEVLVVEGDTALAASAYMNMIPNHQVRIEDVNHAPVLTGLDGTPTYNQGGAAVPVDTDLVISDVDLDAFNLGQGDYDGAGLLLGRDGGLDASDIFGFQNGNNISLIGGNLVKNATVIASFDTSTAGRVFITFSSANGETVSTADVNAIARQVTYANDNEVLPGAVQIRWWLGDANSGEQGSGGGKFSYGISTVDVTGPNDAPLLTGLDATPTFVENGGAIALDTTVSVSDIELDALNGGSGDYHGASLTLLRAGGASPDDGFGFTPGNDITLVAGELVKNGKVIASFDTTTSGQLVITYTRTNGETPTTADVNAIQSQLTYSNTSNLPPASVQIDWSFNDGNVVAQGTGGAESVGGSVVVGITSINEDPAFTGLDESPTFIENGSAVVLDADVALSDPELDARNGGSGDYSDASLTLARNGGISGEDVFGFNDGNGISLVADSLLKNGQVIASFDTSTAGQLVITWTNANGETPTTADATATARQITYGNSSEAPPASVQIDWSFDENVGPTWWHTDWAERVEINLDNRASGEHLTNFPVLVSFTDSDIDFDRIAAGGADIRFVDADGTALVYEIDSWDDTAKTASVWVKVPQVDLGTNTDSIYMYHHNPGATDGQSAAAVWENSIAVLHLDEDPDAGGAGDIKDSDATPNNGTARLSMTSADLVAGQIGDAIRFDGTADYIDFAPTNLGDTFTIEAWIKPDSSKLGGLAIASNSATGFNTDGFRFFIDGAEGELEDGTIRFETGNGVTGDSAYSHAGVVNFDQWNHIAVSVDRLGTTALIYLNGVNVTFDSSIVDDFLVSSDWRIGSFEDGGYRFKGPIDELRVYNTNQSADWIEASWLSQNGSFSFAGFGTKTEWQGLGGAGSVGGSTTVGITRINDDPVLSGLDATPTFVEDGAAIVLDSDVSISDVELDRLDDYDGATLTLVRDTGANSDDVFGFNTGNDITLAGDELLKNGKAIASFDTSTSGQLVITYTNANGETPTAVDVNAIQRQVTYSNSNDLPPASVRIDWSFSDGNVTDQGTGGALSDGGNIVVSITSVNEDPIFAGLDATPTFIEDGSAIVLDADASISDVELDSVNDYDGASLTLVRDTGANAYDVFGFNAGNGITLVGGNLIKNGQAIASFNTSTAGQLVITYTNANGQTPTTADVNAIARQITYSNSSDNPAASVQIDWSFSDGNVTDQGTGGALIDSGNIIVSITSNNDAPTVVSLDDSPTFIEAVDPFVPVSARLDGTVTVSDPELDALNGGAGDYTGASLTIARSGGANSDDFYFFLTENGLTFDGTDIKKAGVSLASFDRSVSGEVTVSFFAATTAEANDILRAITYGNNSPLPPSSVDMDWTFHDGNVASQGLRGDKTDGGTITVNILSRNDAPTFTNLDVGPTFIEDGSAIVLDADVTIADDELDYVNSGNGDYSGASLTLVRNTGANADDVFGFNAGNGITLMGGNLIKNSQVVASFDTSTAGQLVITYTNANGETPTTADVNAIQRQVTYSNSNDLPPASVQIDWSFSDGNVGGQGFGGALVDTGAVTVAITSVNEDPIFAGLDATPTFVEDGAAIVLDSDVAISDVELDSLNDYDGASLTLVRDTGANSDDVFGFNAGNGITLVGGNLIKNAQAIASFDTGTAGQLVITYTNANGQTPTTTDVNNIQRQVTYSNTNDLPPASVQIDWSFSDGNVTDQGAGGALTDSGNIVVSITSVNEDPIFAGLDGTPTFVEDGAAIVLDSDVSISDVELDSLNDYDGASLTLVRDTGANSDDVFGFSAGNGITLIGGNLIKNGQAIASFDTGTAGQLVITYTNVNGETPTTADVNTIQRQVTYSNTNDLPPASVQIDWSFNDGNVTDQGTGGALTDSGAITVSITSVNEDPIFAGLDATPTFVEDGTAVVLDSNVSISDVELDSLNDYDGASLTLVRDTGANSDDVFGFNAGNGITLVGGNLIKNGQAIASFDTGTAGQLVITYTNANGQTPTTTDVNNIQRQVTYSNSNDLPPASVQIDWSFNDGNVTDQGTGGALADNGAITVSITSVNEDPIFAGLDATPTFVEDGAAIVLDSDVAISDVELDSLNDYDGASLTLVRDTGANSDDVFGFNAGNGITLFGGNLIKNGQAIASFDTGTAGQLVITYTNANGETPTTADVNTIQRQVTYSNTNDLPPASVQIDWSFNDGNVTDQGTGGALADNGAITVSITSVNEDPIFAGLDATPTFVEDGTAIVLDADVAISDVELDSLNDYDGASLTLVRDTGANADDVFGFNAGNGITLVGGNLIKNGQAIASFDTGTAGQLVITYTNANGQTPTTTDVNNIQRQVTYSNSNDLPPASVQIDWSFSDGNVTAQGTGGALTDSGNIVVSITSVNEDPIFTGLDGTPTFVEDGSAIVLDSDVSISDVELDSLNDYDGASLTLVRDTGANSDDVFGFNDGNGITLVGGNLIKNGQAIASFDTSTPGQLFITYSNANGETPTSADVNAIQRQVTYSNTNDLPPASVQLDWSFNDGNVTAQGTGGALTDSGNIEVSITSVNEDPIFTGLDGTPTFVEDGAAIVLDSDVSISDVELDSLNDYDGASLTLVRDTGANSDDVFGFSAGNGITLVGGNLIKNGQAIASFDTSTAGQLVITYTNANGQTPTTTDVNNIQRQVSYSNSNDLPPASVQIDWSFSDGNVTDQGTGGALTDSGNIEVSISSVNEDPIFTGLDGTPTFVEDGAAIVLDSDVAISDVELDSLNDYDGASLTLVRDTGANSDDVFGFNDGNGITLVGGNLIKNGQAIASFDTSTPGQLFITYSNANGETPTSADVNAIQRQVTYSNTNDLPPASVQLDWSFNDGNVTAQGTGGALTDSGNIEVSITSVNEDPIFAGLDGTPTFVEDGSAIVLDSDVSISDVELDSLNDYHGASLTLVRDTGANSDDVFGFNAGNGITLVGGNLIKNGQAIASFDTSTGGRLVITYTNANGETPTTADVNTIQRQVTYSNSNDLPPASVQIDWSFSDGNVADQGTGGALTDSGNIEVSITSVNEDPIFTGLDGTPTFVEDGAAIVLDSDVAISDVELDSLNDYDGASLTLVRDTGANSDDVFGFNAGNGITLVGGNLIKNGQAIASFDTGTAGQLVITYTNANGQTPTTTDVNNIQRQVTYSNSNDLPPASVQVDWSFNDGNVTDQGTGGALTDSGAITVSITSVNEDPIFTGLDATPTFVEDGTAVVLDSNVSISDVELDSLNDYDGASLTLVRDTGANSDDVFGFNAGNGITLVGGNLIKNGQAIASFDTGTAGQLVITYTNANGQTPTTTDVNNIQRQVTYSNSNDLPPASVQVDWSFNDGNVTDQGTGGALTDSGAITVSITSVNEDPIFAGLDATPTFVEDGTAVVLDSNVSISDLELDSLNDYNGASLTLVRDTGANSDDVFGFNAGNGITLFGGNLIKNGQAIASFDTSTAGQLVITYTNANGQTPTTTDVNNIQRQVTYSNSNDLPPASVQIDWSFNDGNVTDQGAGGALTDSGNIVVSITSVNEDPIFTGLDNTPTFVEDFAAIVIDGNVVISDVELDAFNGGTGDYHGASLGLARSGVASSDDVFGFNDGNGITLIGSDLVKNGQVIASFDTSAAGQLLITYTHDNGEVPTTADVNNIQRQVTYSNSNDLPPASVQIDWDFDDGNTGAQGTGGMLSVGGSINVSITSTNENPVLSGLDATPTFTEDGAAVVLDADVTLSDVELDSLDDYSGASLTLVRNTGANSDDVFGFNAGNGITAVGGSLIKNGQAIASFDTSTAGQLVITYSNANGETPTTNDVNNIQRQITYSNSNDLPPASVQIDWNFSDGNIAAQGAGGALGSSGAITVSIESVNEGPVFSGLNAVPTFTEDDSPVVLDSDVTIADKELNILDDYDGASLTLVRNSGANSDDVFGFNAGNGITLAGNNLVKNGQIIAAFDTGTAGQLVLTYTNANGETPTASDVNNIQRQITYSNTSDNPQAAIWLNWSFDDGNAGAQGNGGVGVQSQLQFVVINATNDDPVLLGVDGTPGFIEDGPAVLLDSSVSATDPELDVLNFGNGNYSGASLTLVRSSGVDAEDVFGFADGNGISLVAGSLVKNGQAIAGFGVGTPGELVISWTDAFGEIPTTSDISLIQQQITYSNSNDNPPASVALDWTLADGDGGSDTASLTVSITPSNDAPDIKGLANTPTFFEDSGAVILDSVVGIEDAELDALNGGSGNYDGARLTLLRNTGANADDAFGFVDGNGISLVGNSLIKNDQVIASFDTSVSGQLAITYTDANGELPTTADARIVAGQITYSNSNDNPPASVQLDWTLDDGNSGLQGLGGAASITASMSVDISSHNDNPTLTGLDSRPLFIEDGAAIVLDSSLVAADVELDVLNGGSGNYAGASLTLARSGGINTDDAFSFNDGNGISLVGSSLVKNGQVIASFDTSTTGQLLIRYTDANAEIPTTADVTAIQQQLTYSNSSDTPALSVNIDWTLNDGNVGGQGDGGAGAVTQSQTIDITASNDKPLLTGVDANPTLVEDSGAVILDSSVSLGDAEMDALNGGSGDYDGASLMLERNGGANGDDVFGFSNGNGVSLVGANLIKNGQLIASFDTSASGQLLITYTNANGEVPTTADVNNIQRQVTYSNSNDNPPSAVQIDWIISDGNVASQGIGGAATDSADMSVAITPTNDDPGLVGLDDRPLFTEDNAPVVLDSSVSVTDPELDVLNSGNGNYAGASLTLQRVASVNSDDVFSFNDGNGISLIGANLVKNGQLIAMFDVSTAGQLLISYTDASGEVPDTADVTAIAQQITYSNSSDNPAAAIGIQWTLVDGNSGAQGGGGAATFSQVQTVDIASSNDAPSFVGLDAAPTFVEDGNAVILDSSLSVVDPELDVLNGGGGNYSGASLTLVRSTGASSDDVFSFEDGNGITLVGANLIKNGQVVASFDASTPGQLLIRFTDAAGEIPTTADVSVVQQQISYSNTIDTPPFSVEMEWTLDDGQGGNAVASQFVTIAANNDAPVLQALDDVPVYVERLTPVILDADMVVSDAELDWLNGGQGNYSGASLIVVRDAGANPDDNFGFVDVAGISRAGVDLVKNGQVIASFDTTTSGQLTVLFTDANGVVPSTADVNAIARALNYSNTNDAPPASVTLSWTLSDGDGSSTSGQSSVDIVAVDYEAPTLEINIAVEAVRGQTTVLSSAALSYSDAEQLNENVAYTLVANPVHGHIALSGAPEVALSSFTQAQLDAGEIIYVHTGPVLADDQIAFTVDDGQGNVLAEQAFDINVTEDEFPITEGPLSVKFNHEIFDETEVADPGELDTYVVPDGTELSVAEEPLSELSDVAKARTESTLGLHYLLTPIAAGGTDTELLFGDDDSEVDLTVRLGSGVEVSPFRAMDVERSEVIYVAGASMAPKDEAASSQLLFALDDMRSQLERAITDQYDQELLVDSALKLTGITFSAGYLAWLLRAGPLVASMATSLPVWARFDPLPVVLADNRNKEEEVQIDDDTDAQQEAAARSILEANSSGNNSTSEKESLQ